MAMLSSPFLRLLGRPFFIWLDFSNLSRHQSQGEGLPKHRPPGPASRVCVSVGLERA